MPIYNAQTIPSAVGSSSKDSEIAQWLKTGPRHGRSLAIAAQGCALRTWPRGLGVPSNPEECNL